jgi:hypothetical protein
VIYYGTNLENYFVREFENPEAALELPIKRIDFWSDLADRYGESSAI